MRAFSPKYAPLVRVRMCWVSAFTAGFFWLTSTCNGEIFNQLVPHRVSAGNMNTQRPGKFGDFSPCRCPEIAIPACFVFINHLFLRVSKIFSAEIQETSKTFLMPAFKYCSGIVQKFLTFYMMWDCTGKNLFPHIISPHLKWVKNSISWIFTDNLGDFLW